MIPSSNNRQRACTLVEILVSMALLTMTFGFMMKALSEAALIRGRGELRTLMISAAQNELDAATRNPTDTLALGTIDVPTGNNSIVLIQRTVTPRNDGVAEIEIEVTGRGIEGNQTVKLTTLRRFPT